jgi:hypothetical protein
MGGGDEADAEFVTNDALDTRDRAEVLREVLLTYPEMFTLDELTCELTVASTETGRRGRWPE